MASFLSCLSRPGLEVCKSRGACMGIRGKQWAWRGKSMLWLPVLTARSRPRATPPPRKAINMDPAVALLGARRRLVLRCPRGSYLKKMGDRDGRA